VILIPLRSPGRAATYNIIVMLMRAGGTLRILLCRRVTGALWRPYLAATSSLLSYMLGEMLRSLDLVASSWCRSSRVTLKNLTVEISARGSDPARALLTAQFLFPRADATISWLVDFSPVALYFSMAILEQSFDTSSLPLCGIRDFDSPTLPYFFITCCLRASRVDRWPQAIFART